MWRRLSTAAKLLPQGAGFIARSLAAGSLRTNNVAMFGQWIEQTRQNFGNPPRSFSGDVAQQIMVRPPSFLFENKRDKLWKQYNQFNAIFAHGVVVWAHIIQAHHTLFEEHPEDAGAAFLYSLDPYFDDNAFDLEEVAANLFDTKGQRIRDREVQRFADMLADEYERQLLLPIPRSLTRGRDVIYTCGVIARRHLPLPFLARALFPLIVVPGKTDASWVLPSMWWADGLLQMWFEALDA